MSSIDKRELREAAEKATPGPWEYYPGNTSIEYNVDSMVEDQGSIVYVDSGDFTQKQTDLNGAFIAAANPATVLALLDERERNQQYIKRRDQENEEIALTVGKLRVELEGKDKLIAELGKQCAEWERKALSNFEECAAMAERIEEMSKQSCEARERDLFESWVMHSICISKSTLEGLRTETGYRNATLSGTDFNRMWKQWKSIRAAGIRIKGE
ncbi:ead/Ea22-like family protein [Escherichia coli]|uniref:ead/Ea22-like family protein n=1 Tax=Escherichia coli TaxID=562 RepID=UPI002C0E339A|nr:ead/Ea22-like family protein [Escherichia coli]MEB3554990.1 ead/Ea22-like family protein [Escherichia coli]MED8112034.1 ead/Ea22-like family protein [Escherichia coli]MED8179809.1 ead/Ea22-like family protein [Escherichia coli]